MQSVCCVVKYGLYTAFMGCFVYTLFGGARDLTYGPTAIMALLTAEFAHGGSVHSAVLLTFLSGIIQMGIAVAHIGTQLSIHSRNSNSLHR